MSDHQPELFQITTGLGGTKYVPTVNRNVVITAKKAHPTSQRAAINAYPRSGSKRQKIYNAIKLFGGMTDEEIEKWKLGFMAGFNYFKQMLKSK